MIGQGFRSPLELPTFCTAVLEPDLFVTPMQRRGRDDVIRYQALYDDVKGHRGSAGTFATQKDADKAWQRAEGPTGQILVHCQQRRRRLMRALQGSA